MHAYFVGPIKDVVNVIYSQKIYTIVLLTSMMLYNLLSKFIYTPMSDYLFILNSKKIKTSSHPKARQAYEVCSRMMRISTIMTLISYIIRIVIILIFAGVLFVDNSIFTLLTTINLFFTIIQSTMVSMVYFIDNKIGEKMDITFGIKLSMFFSNIIGMIFQIIYLCRILNANSNTVFHTIIAMIYCGCINYLLLNQVYLCGLITAINLLIAILICFSLFWDYFVSSNSSNYTLGQQITVMVFFVIVTSIVPLIVFIIARHSIKDRATKYSVISDARE